MNTLTKRLLQSRLLAAGIVFFAVNATTSYMFYQVNSYKLLVLIAGISLLAVFCEAFLFKGGEDRIAWKDLLVLSLPLLATVPGYILHQGQYNYNFSYELVTNLLLILWVFYLCRTARSQKDLSAFIVLLGITVIYGCLWAILDKLGYYPQVSGEGNLQISSIWVVLKKFFSNPLDWNISIIGKVKSSFGHRNYFSGFLILLLPIFLVFSVPEEVKENLSNKTKVRVSKSNIFYLTIFLMGIAALLAVQTRAAIAACGLGVILTLCLYYFHFVPALWRKRPLIPIMAVLIFCALSAVLMFFFFGKLEMMRIFDLFSYKGWAGRLLPWQTAISSIKASPFTGFGLGSSYNLFFSYINPDARLFHHERSYNHAHSEILEYLQESGALGLLAYIAFWAYIIFLLVRILRTSSDKFFTKLAIGICGGFLAYHAHSTFSVAPRMVVTKLPLFTLFALVFISARLLKIGKPPKATSFKAKTAAMAASFIVIASVWFMYVPWIKGQYGFVKIEQKRPSLLKVMELEQLVENYRDIYALDRVSYYQIQYKRTAQLRKSIEKIESIIPHYRELGFKKLILAVMENDFKAAKKAGLEFQKSDSYYVSGINLLTRLALKTGDYQLFTQQFRLITKLAIFQNKLVSTKDSSKVQVEIKKIPKNLIAEEKGDSLSITWNENLIKLIFSQGLRFWRKSNSQHILNVQKVLTDGFLKSPYFITSNIRKSLAEDEFKKTESELKAYLMHKNKFHFLTNRINKKYKGKTGGNNKDAKLLKKRRAEELKKVKDSYLPKLEGYEEFLKDRMDFDVFNSRRRFMKSFINKLNAAMFQTK